MNNLKFEHYQKLKSFDEIKFLDLLKLINKSKDMLLQDGWKSHDENQTIDIIDFDDDKYRFSKMGLYYPKSRNPKEILNITLDIQNKTISKDRYHNGIFTFIEIPNEFFKKYLNQYNHNSDVTILNKFLDEVDWGGDWKSLMNEYDKKYPQKHITNKKEGEFSWRANFSVEWFLSIKYDGLITPMVLLESGDAIELFARGSHRAFMLSSLGYGFPIFVPKDVDKLTTSNYFKGMKLTIEIDYTNRELNVYDGKNLLEKYRYN